MSRLAALRLRLRLRRCRARYHYQHPGEDRLIRCQVRGPHRTHEAVLPDFWRIAGPGGGGAEWPVDEDDPLYGSG